VDTHIHSGYKVSPYYDSLIAKLIVHAPTRAEAMTRMREALAVTEVEGISRQFTPAAVNASVRNAMVDGSLRSIALMPPSEAS
ncbi:hypothetical protein ACC754_42105, partial [Rhizobium johnstonii]